MRKHGWQLPYHPLQVVAVAVFLALGFAFYVFFAPFVGKTMFQYIVMGIYTPLIILVFSLYIWSAAADPADPGVFKSKKYVKIPDKKHIQFNESKLSAKSASSTQDAIAATPGEKVLDKTNISIDERAQHTLESEKKNPSSRQISCFMAMLALLPCTYVCNSNEESSEQQMTEDGMFYCSLCDVEVFKYSKHCRVCDKCVDRFDHHCRWLNNCVGKRNYQKFFTLMVSALLLLILQWSTGILVLVRCFLDRKKYSVDIATKLGSSFTVIPFVIVVAVCTILAMIATLPLAQLFFFHILLIKKGISTYDYIIALREQDQQAAGGQQSPQMSTHSSLTGLSSTSSLNTFHRAAWCTPPRLFVENQFVVPPDNVSVSSLGKKTVMEEPTKKKNPMAVKISPWTLARLNAEEVSKAAAEARKKSKILQPIDRREGTYPVEINASFVRSGPRLTPRPDNNRKRGSKRIRLPIDVPFDPHYKISSENEENGRSDFQTSRACVISSSPESSLDSPELHPFGRELVGRSTTAMGFQKEIPFSRSTSDGYEASGGEDSDQIPSRFVERSSNWNRLLFASEGNRTITKLAMPSSSSVL